MLSPPVSIDPITVRALLPQLAPCLSNPRRSSNSPGRSILCASFAAGSSPAFGMRFVSVKFGSGHEMLAPVRCPFVRLQIVLSQDQSSTLEGHLHAHGTPLPLNGRWIRAKRGWAARESKHSIAARSRKCLTDPAFWDRSGCARGAVGGSELRSFEGVRLGWPTFKARTGRASHRRAVGGHLQARRRGHLWCCRCWLSRTAWRVWWSRYARLGALRAALA